MALKLDILANTRQLISEMRKGGASVDDVSDALDDMAKEGDRAGDKLEASFRDMARNAKRAGDDVKTGVGGGLRDLKDEAGQSGREAAASFSGEWSDVGDFVQETVANGLSGFGPLGAAAGIAAAAGIGVLTSTILSQQEAADELRDRLSSAYQTAADEGRTYLDTAQLIAEASDLMFNPDRANEYKQLVADSKNLGLDLYDVIAANAGAQDKQREVQERVNDLLRDYKEDAADGQVENDLVGPLIELSDRWRTVIDLTEQEQEKARQLSEIQKQAEQDNRDQIERSARAAQERYEGLARSMGMNPIRLKVQLDDNAAWAQLNRLTSPKSVDMRVKPRGTAEWE